ncbi:hypothetical protein COU80_05250 [Candidatus Peregrinibacteria bacterium CG10_big_fil_rev_8_21_14_0_10_55_24]|nr:MAG: hypothetical protein COU80_05250 [Candidatus Peregrinibacteria bacterium CG10_big_fil_rev_8_21_14_0_10_55_24]
MKFPAPLRWIYQGWMAFSHALGRVMSWIILTVVWLTIFGIYGIIVNIVNLLKPKSAPHTYWVDPFPQPPEAMRHQF